MAAFMRTTLSKIVSVRQAIHVPERLQRGFPKKIGEYMSAMYRDYRAATVDVFTDMKQRPFKAGFYLTCLGLFGYAAMQNPDEESYEEKLVEASNDLLLLSNLTRNQDSDKYIQNLLALKNGGVLRYTNFVVCAVIWEDNFDKRVSLYDAKCDYLQVSWRLFPDRIRDVGFLGKWRHISQAMEDYDINYLEFPNNVSSGSIS